MTKLMVVSIFVALAVIVSPVYGMVAPMTPFEHYSKDDVILVGKVISLEENSTTSETSYQVKVEKYLKNPPQISDVIVAVGKGVQNSTTHTSIDKIFSKGDRVFLFLNYVGGSYVISPYSANAARFNPDSFILPPHKLVKAGILSKDIVCRDDLKLVFKHSDNSPACVKQSNVNKLIQRGWAK